MKFTKLVKDIKSTNLSVSVTLQFNEQCYTIKSNDPALITALKSYFKEWLSDNTKQATATITAWQCETPDFDLDYTEYRETPEKRIKEAFAEIDNFRIVKKIKTGVHFAIGDNEWMAFGPLTTYPNQLINFVNAIFMEVNLHGNAFLFHAAGVAKNNEGIVIAAQSGKGKSTTSLFLVNAGLDFISNDRVILQKENKDFTMIGVPKHPRVNPGTLLNNAQISHLLKEPERFEGKSEEEIWNWEEKYDVVIPDIYGKEKFKLSAKAKAFLIIDWGEDDSPLRLEKINLATRPDLLPEIMKKPSLMTPHIHALKKDCSAQDYLNFIDGLPVYILKGKINPQEGIALILQQFFQ